MTKKTTASKTRSKRLKLGKETLKDLGARRNVKGGALFASGKCQGETLGCGQGTMGGQTLGVTCGVVVRSAGCGIKGGP